MHKRQRLTHEPGAKAQEEAKQVVRRLTEAHLVRHIGEFAGTECEALTRSGVDCRRTFIFPSCVHPRSERVDCEAYCWDICPRWLSDVLDVQMLPTRVLLTDKDNVNDSMEMEVLPSEASNHIRMEIALNNLAAQCSSSLFSITARLYPHWVIVRDKFLARLYPRRFRTAQGEVAFEKKPYITELVAYAPRAPGATSRDFYEAMSATELANVLCWYLRTSPFTALTWSLYLQRTPASDAWYERHRDRVRVHFPEFEHYTFLGHERHWHVNSQVWDRVPTIQYTFTPPGTDEYEFKPNAPETAGPRPPGRCEPFVARTMQASESYLPPASKRTRSERS